jgi:hypothetical protein
MLRKWRARRDGGVPLQRRGRKVNADFEKEVLSQLIFIVIDRAKTQRELITAVTSVHSYEMIVTAAQGVQKTKRWLKDAKVQALRFGSSWVRGFLNRYALSRRAVTSQAKLTPADVAAAQVRMKAIQDVIDAEGFGPDDIINADETAIFYAAGPLMMYAFKGVQRVSAPPTNQKARITVMAWGFASGLMGPAFIIIKNASTGADQTGSRVLKSLLDEGNLAGNWEHRVWQREMTINIKGKPVTAFFRRNFLINTDTNVVITANPKAWMDSVTMALWADEQVARVRRTAGGGQRKTLLVMDNCGPHKVLAVIGAFAEHLVRVEHLPPNTTAELQVMDRVVNFPLKAAMRKQYSLMHHAAFLMWVKQVSGFVDKKTRVSLVPLPAFSPPPMELHEGINTLLSCWAKDGLFTRPSFKESMARCFVSVGLQRNAAGAYVRFTQTFMKVPVPPAMANAFPDKRFSVGDLTSGLELLHVGDGEVNASDEAASALGEEDAAAAAGAGGGGAAAPPSRDDDDGDDSGDSSGSDGSGDSDGSAGSDDSDDDDAEEEQQSEDDSWLSGSDDSDCGFRRRKQARKTVRRARTTLSTATAAAAASTSAGAGFALAPESEDDSWLSGLDDSDFGFRRRKPSKKTTGGRATGTTATAAATSSTSSDAVIVPVPRKAKTIVVNETKEPAVEGEKFVAGLWDKYNSSVLDRPAKALGALQKVWDKISVIVEDFIAMGDAGLDKVARWNSLRRGAEAAIAAGEAATFKFLYQL